ncbi:MAG: D-alanyl-D-alanine carboxypeptidase [Clostridia bacterium]|nr:D-alanyl-D-alanine carboxypeptidase [Clostridia bacterium]
MRWISILSIFLCIFCCSGFCYGDFSDIDKLPAPSLVSASSASSAYVYEVNSGRVFLEKNATVERAMASTTKIATAITAIENCEDLDSKFAIDNRAVGIEGSSIYLRANETMSMRDLLYGLMLRSGNDCACVIAYHISGSIDEFAALMNGLVDKLQLKHTHFTNPHGLDAQSHYTSAQDLALITGYALSNPVFSEIVSTKNIKISDDSGEVRYMANKNRLLNSLEGCIGVKTGYTTRAGRCLVSAVERDGLKLVAVVLNCGPMFEESSAILNEICSKYKMTEVLSPWQYIDDIPLLNGETDFVQAFSKKGFYLPLSEEECGLVSLEVDIPPRLIAPIANETEIGEVKIYYEKHLIFSEKIYTLREVDSKLIKDKVKQILDHWGT